MNSTLVNVIYGFYAGTIVINIVVAAMQVWTEREHSKKLVLMFWSAILLSVLANTVLTDIGLTMVLVAALGTFVSQTILGSVFAEVLGMKLSFRPVTLFFLVCAVGATVLKNLGMPFEVYALLAVMGGTAPIFYYIIFSWRGRKRSLNSVQKMFVCTAILMGIHYLDWPFFRTRPELFIIGSSLAFGLFHILSILIPMMVVEHTLYLKNLRLEDEIRRRVDQLTETQEHLWETSKLASLGRMAGGVAHELNSPLTIIALHADRIRHDAQSSRMTPENAITHVNGIHEMIRRISKVTEALRKLASDRMSSKRKIIDIRSIVDEATSLLKGQISGAGIQFSLNMDEGDWMAFCDPTEILQAITNLLDNAIDAVETLNTKWIHVNGTHQGLFLEISVEDSGKINQEIMTRVMEPFYTTKPVGQGAGLGLSVAKAIAEGHGGGLVLDHHAETTRFVLRISKGLNKSSDSGNYNNEKRIHGDC